ncbi:hypothetical protein [Streptomyces resistomycificus]|uniref:Uncharacterized protein n=1 Tax=Streptomyces resistomycificus TaxID=67356 RepID=A0A0L8L5F7_9ACTN|nr:hypothetical protein [Streptomyces resistomycificus]KOG33334.1 hypothetical protein ADK37_23450 [Streptomyces resistomycificus]KUN99544.1 hypothetical protein AQJ84_11390 [Streptomyces resistomycificus]
MTVADLAALPPVVRVHGLAALVGIQPADSGPGETWEELCDRLSHGTRGPFRIYVDRNGNVTEATR